MIVHQMGSVLSVGDAVTNHMMEIDRRLRRWGFDARIYGADITAAPKGRAASDREYDPATGGSEDLLIYHYSAYCDNYRLFQRTRHRKILIYHNVTPPEFYRPYDPFYESICARGRDLLGELAECDLALGVSEYNRRELVERGFGEERTAVLPLFLGVEDFGNCSRSGSLYRELKLAGDGNILFVGKVAPNKAYEDLIKVFASYRRYVAPRAKLILAGARFLPAYDAVLDALTERLQLRGAVIFTNRLSLAELKSCYEAADAFLCTSKHEGFCVPLLEAMHFQLPILARATTAVPDTLGDAGLQFTALNYPYLAEVLGVVLADPMLRRQIVEGQNRRVRDFAPARVEAQLVAVLARIGISTPAGARVP